MYGAGVDSDSESVVNGANYTYGEGLYPYKTSLLSSFKYHHDYSTPVSQPGPCKLAVKYAEEAAMLMHKIKILEHELRALLHEGSVLAASINALADKCQLVTVTTTAPVYQQPVTSTPLYQQPVTSAPVYQQPVSSAPVYQQPVSAAPYQQSTTGTTPTTPTTTGGKRVLNYATTSYYPPPVLTSPNTATLQNLEECLIRLHKLLERARSLTKAALTYVAASEILENRLALAEAQLQQCLRVQSTITTYPSNYNSPVSSSPRYLEETDDVHGAGYYSVSSAVPPCTAEAAAVAQLQRDVCTVELSLLDTINKLSNTWAAIDDVVNRCFGVESVITSIPIYTSKTASMYPNTITSSPLTNNYNYRRLRGNNNEEGMEA